MVSYIALLLYFLHIVGSDYYAGVFNKNDFLVAQDHLYKERIPFRAAQSMYGRYFKCPITYFRVMDRLGMSRGPRVLVTRGGLGHRFLTLRITAQYNLPTSVTILVGCENKNKSTKLSTKASTVAPEASSAKPGDVTSVAPTQPSDPAGGGGGASANSTEKTGTITTTVAPTNSSTPAVNASSTTTVAPTNSSTPAVNASSTTTAAPTNSSTPADNESSTTTAPPPT